MITSALRDIYRINLGVKAHERVLLFNDRIAEKERPSPQEREQRESLRSIALLAADVGKEFCSSLRYYEYPATGSHGAEPPEELWDRAFGSRAIKALRKDALLSPIIEKQVTREDLRRAEEIIGKHRREAVDCIVALAYYSTSHTRFRDFLTRICGSRYASMPLFDAAMLEGAMNVDWKELARLTRQVARTMRGCRTIIVRAPNGTSLSLSVLGRRVHADTGILTRRGSFGNLPAGEVFVAPVEGTAQGVLVLEWGPTRRFSPPITLTVRDGNVVDIAGADDYAAYLRMRLSERRENANIAEFGVGTNRAARRPDNILESEKIFGTIHIALGDNSSFGGNVKTPFHQDFVFFRPTVTLLRTDGSREVLLSDGTFGGRRDDSG